MQWPLGIRQSGRPAFAGPRGWLKAPKPVAVRDAMAEARASRPIASWYHTEYKTAQRAGARRLLLGELGLLPLEQRALPLAMVRVLWPDTSAQRQRWTESALDFG